MMSFSRIAADITIDTRVPGLANSSSTGVSGIVANFYAFALILSGILAFGAIVYGGVRYAASAGNPSGQNDAKGWITGALLGLLLLASAYVILRTVNPTLVSLTEPGLEYVPLTGGAAPIVSNACGASSCNPTNQICWSSPTGQQCVAAIDGRAMCGVEGGRNNGPCADSSHTCADVAGNGIWQCVSNDVTKNACSDSNPTGTCTDPAAKCTLVSGHYSCVSQNPQSNACKGRDPGSCVWIGIQPQPSGCSGYGGVISDQDCKSPPSKPQCYEQYHC